MKNLVFSYRLTDFTGAAPCYDGDCLSLAICKSIMRRVIGREMTSNSGRENVYWVLGIAGLGLAGKNPNFQSEDIVYAAKIARPVSYEAYFSDTADRRSDKIYTPHKKGHYRDGNTRFKPLKNPIHTDKAAWDTDWDVKRLNDGKYVLISEKYAFLNQEQSKRIYELKGDENSFPKGRKYRIFQYDDGHKLINFLDELVGEKRHGLENLPTDLQPEAVCCGK